MTIKHTKKDIGSEDQKAVVGIAKSGGSVDSNTKNFSNDLVIKLKTQDQYREEGEEDTNPGRDLTIVTSSASADKITIPLASLVRQEHLTQNYYTKSQIDAHVKPSYQILQSTNALPTAAQIRQNENQNVIYLVPIEDSETGDIEFYEEYMYVIEGTDTSTEKVEKIGSTKVDLSQYLRRDEMSSTYVETSKIADNLTTNDASYVLSAKQGKALNDGKANTQHNHGIINYNGTTSEVRSGILTTNSMGTIQLNSQLQAVKIISLNNYTNIDSSQYDDLETILGKINTKLADITTISNSLSNYLLKSEIYTEIWGTNANGFNSMQTAEANNSASKNYKLGDYIYSKVYTKSDIDTLIGTLAQLQQQTLNIL